MSDNPAASASKLAAKVPSLPTTPARPWSLDAWLLARIGAAIGTVPLRFELWNGVERTLAPGAPVACVFVADRRTLLRLALDPEFEFGDAYSEGRVEVMGGLVAFLEVLYGGLEDRRARGAGRKRAWLARRANDLKRARANVHRHYDLGNDFYRLWLDERMVYTCAYFSSPEVGLEEAQLAKMDLVCRKLRLRRGERVVEAGCGWGALALSEVFEGVLEPWGFSVLDVENLRLHYARALEHWRARFEAVAGRVATSFDERFVRAWRLYLAGSQAAFSTGSLQLFQVLFGRPGDNDVPWTRQEHTGPREVPRGIV